MLGKIAGAYTVLVPFTTAFLRLKIFDRDYFAKFQNDSVRVCFNCKSIAVRKSFVSECMA